MTIFAVHVAGLEQDKLAKVDFIVGTVREKLDAPGERLFVHVAGGQMYDEQEHARRSLYYASAVFARATPPEAPPLWDAAGRMQSFRLFS